MKETDYEMGKLVKSILFRNKELNLQNAALSQRVSSLESEIEGFKRAATAIPSTCEG